MTAGKQQRERGTYAIKPPLVRRCSRLKIPVSG